MPTTVIKQTTHFNVVVHTHRRLDLKSGDGHRLGPNYIFGGGPDETTWGYHNSTFYKAAVNVVTSKSLNTPVGTYSVTLALDYPSQHNVLSYILPGDWCTVLASTNSHKLSVAGQVSSSTGEGTSRVPLMRGPISSIRRIRSVGADGKPSTSIMIEGHDFGKLLTDSSIVRDPKLLSKIGKNVTLADFPMMAVLSESGKLSGNPRDVIVNLLRTFFGPEDPQCIDPETDAPFGADLLDPSGESFPYIASNNAYHGSTVVTPVGVANNLWELLQHYANLPVNELFIDYRVAWSKRQRREYVLPESYKQQEGIEDADPEEVREHIAKIKAGIIDATSPIASSTGGLDSKTLNHIIEVGPVPYADAASGPWKDMTQVLLVSGEGETKTSELKYGYRNVEVDATTLVPAIVLRRQPFLRQDWDNLHTNQLEEIEVFQENLGRSDADVRNWIRLGDNPRVLSSKESSSVYDLELGYANRESIRRFGFRRLEPVTEYFLNPKDSTADSQIQPNTNILKLFNGLLALWHHSNERLIGGTLRTRFRPDIRIGQKLHYRSSEPIPTTLSTNIDPDSLTASDKLYGKVYEYYVTGVTHNLTYPNNCSTTITVTRGAFVEDPRYHLDLEVLEDLDILTGLGPASIRIQELIDSIYGRRQPSWKTGEPASIDTNTETSNNQSNED